MTIPFHLLFWIALVGIVCNVSCAILGCFLLLRRMSMLGDAIAHGVLPGIAVGVLLSGHVTGWGLIVGAMAFGLLTAFLTQVIATQAGVAEDASMGIVFTSLFALGVIMVSVSSAHIDDCIFYGSIQQAGLDTFLVLGWRIPQMLPAMLISLALTVGFVLLFWKELKIVSFDPALATAMGLNATLIHYLLMTAVSAVTVTSFSAIGSILVIAMLIVPAACGHLLSDRLVGMMGWAIAVAIVSAVLGTFLTPGWGNVPGMMVLVAGGQLVLAVLFAPRHGVLAKAFRNVQLSVRIVAEDILANLYRREENPQAANNPPVGTLMRGFTGWLALASLQRSGEVENGSALQLTTAGRQRAESLVRAHRLWEAFLDKNFDLPLDHLHESAKRMEHFIGPDLQKELAADLEEPGVDPHGRAIPPG